MKNSRIKLIVVNIVVGLVLLAIATGCASQQGAAYPNGNISMIIPYSAGGNADTVGRFVAQYLGDELGVQVTVVNKPGSSGELGAMEIANAKPDGYTIGFLNSPDYIISSIVNPTFEFDLYESVDYIASFTDTPFSYYSKEGGEIDSWQKFVDYAKENPGHLTVAEGGIAHRVLAASIMDKFDIEFTTIGFNGASDVVSALLGDQVDAASSGNQQISSYLPKGYIPIAWGGDEPPAEYPDAPLFKDYGLSVDFLAVANTLVMPKGVPDDVVQKITEAVEKVSQTQELIDQIEATGYRYKAVMGEELLNNIDENYNTIKELTDQYTDVILNQ
ncbi:tripartite tricarboxylate transporter substrate binding protein [Alkalihalobacillus oceani]|uniref:Tripartite tricarboxylate transporter substrate binding protein n=1 Tax=Halalkalibacter oceani TaxID=1653776 RepID=A0A9X2IML0_9BACI|nr:tripartite tricarboxylate transporter substrate binding protein [Halalkalibacter oceani]MCM3712477.1 tripartite tricarboxylate transporter substrate binding protein [Halalkalibacter oceani]